jgi:hypothetical protein
MIKVTSGSPELRAVGGVLSHFFLADTLPFTQAFMAQCGLTSQLDEQNRVIGVNWKLANFPGLNLFIARDGSLGVNGQTQHTFRLTSSGEIHLQNFTAPALALKAKQVRLFGRAVIDLGSPEGTAVISEGALVSVPQLEVK